MHAFFKDVMDGSEKTTDIDASGRVILATTSLTEVIFLFAPIYLFNHHLFVDSMNFTYNISSLFYSFGISTLTDVTFNSVGRTVALVTMLQVLTSMVLIIFTFARYIGEIKTASGSTRRNRCTKAFASRRRINKTKMISR